MLPLAVASLALGAYQTFEGIRGLSKLNKQPFPNYTLHPDVQKASDQAWKNSERGLSPEEMAKARGDIAGVGNRRYTLGKDIAGGSMSRTLQNAVNYSSLGAYTNLADIDSKRHQENIRYAHSMAKYLQGEQNRATSEDIRKRYAQESAFGGAMRTGTENMANSLNLTQAMNFNKDLLTGKFGKLNLSSPTNSTEGEGAGGIGNNNPYSNPYYFGGINLNESVGKSSPLFGNYWRSSGAPLRTRTSAEPFEYTE